MKEVQFIRYKLDNIDMEEMSNVSKYLCQACPNTQFVFIPDDLKLVNKITEREYLEAMRDAINTQLKLLDEKGENGEHYPF